MTSPFRDKCNPGKGMIQRRLRVFEQGERTRHSVPVVYEPTPPSGYRLGYILRYQTLALNAAAIVSLLILLPIFALITWHLQGSTVLSVVFPLTLTDTVAAWFVGLVTVVLHEVLHGVTLRACGYQVSFGIAWRVLAAYTAAFRQFQNRDHALLILVVPVIVLTAMTLPLLAVTQHSIVIIAFVALVTNSVGSVSDLFLTWRLLQLPRYALLYDVDPEHLLIFLPLEG